AVDRADGAALVEHVAAEARPNRLDPEREVELHRFFEALLLRVGEHAVHELLRLVRLEIGHPQTLQMAVHPDLRRRVRRDVEVRSVHLHHRLQEFWKCRHRCPLYLTVSRTTSSSVVSPAATLRSPLPRSVIIPSSTAL